LIKLTTRFRHFNFFLTDLFERRETTLIDILPSNLNPSPCFLLLKLFHKMKFRGTSERCRRPKKLGPLRNSGRGVLLSWKIAPCLPLWVLKLGKLQRCSAPGPRNKMEKGPATALPGLWRCMGINGITHLVSGGSKVAEEYTRKQRLISRAIGPGVGEVKEYVSSMTIAMLYGLPAWL
jgi:hypothetical protein